MRAPFAALSLPARVSGKTLFFFGFRVRQKKNGGPRGRPAVRNVRVQRSLFALRPSSAVPCISKSSVKNAHRADAFARPSFVPSEPSHPYPVPRNLNRKCRTPGNSRLLTKCEQYHIWKCNRRKRRCVENSSTATRGTFPRPYGGAQAKNGLAPLDSTTPIADRTRASASRRKRVL